MFLWTSRNHAFEWRNCFTPFNRKFWKATVCFACFHVTLVCCRFALQTRRGGLVKVYDSALMSGVSFAFVFVTIYFYYEYWILWEKWYIVNNTLVIVFCSPSTKVYSSRNRRQSMNSFRCFWVATVPRNESSNFPFTRFRRAKSTRENCIPTTRHWRLHKDGPALIDIYESDAIRTIILTEERWENDSHNSKNIRNL